MRAWRVSVLEGVLDLLAGLLEVGLRLVALALSLQLVVAGDVADALLGLAAEVFHLVVDLVVETHWPSSIERVVLLCGPVHAITPVRPAHVGTHRASRGRTMAACRPSTSSCSERDQ